MVLRKFSVNDQSQKHLLNTYHVTDTFRYLKARLYCHHQYWFIQVTRGQQVKISTENIPELSLLMVLI